MQKGNLTREQAIDIVGELAVEKVERVSCAETNRVGYNGASQGDELTEWAAGYRCHDKSGEAVTLRAYYYTTNDDDRILAENDGDGSAIDWEIVGYEVA